MLHDEHFYLQEYNGVYSTENKSTFLRNIIVFRVEELAKQETHTKQNDMIYVFHKAPIDNITIFFLNTNIYLQ
jgi:hypothetical protein